MHAQNTRIYVTTCNPWWPAEHTEVLRWSAEVSALDCGCKMTWKWTSAFERCYFWHISAQLAQQILPYIMLPDFSFPSQPYRVPTNGRRDVTKCLHWLQVWLWATSKQLVCKEDTPSLRPLPSHCSMTYIQTLPNAANSSGDSNMQLICLLNRQRNME